MQCAEFPPYKEIIREDSNSWEAELVSVYNVESCQNIEVELPSSIDDALEVGSQTFRVRHISTSSAKPKASIDDTRTRPTITNSGTNMDGATLGVNEALADIEQMLQYYGEQSRQNHKEKKQRSRKSKKTNKDRVVSGSKYPPPAEVQAVSQESGELFKRQRVGETILADLENLIKLFG